MTDFDLWWGDSLKLTETITVKNPKITEIKNLKDEGYAKYLNAICATPYDLMVELHDNGIMYTDLTDFGLFIGMCVQNLQNCKNEDEIKDNIYYKSFIFWFGKMFFPCQNTENNTWFLQSESGEIIDEFLFKEITTFIKKLNFISLAPKFSPNNKRAKEFLIEQTRVEQKDKTSISKVSLQSICSSIRCKGISKQEITEMSIYELYESYYRMSIIDNYDKTMAGICSGTVDSSKMNLDEINWANMISVK